MAFTTKMLINGKLVDGDRTLEVKDPATRDTVAVVACASESQALAAVAAAKVAQPDWERLGWNARAQLLLAYADAIQQRAPELAEAMVREQGKPLAEAQGEVSYTEAFVRHFAGLTLPVEVIQNDDKGRIEVMRKALGVVVGISPWNFPALVPAAKLAPAILAGNTVVLKPAPTTPICALMLGEIAQSIFPAGVVNVVTDQNDLGSLLTSHPDVAKVTFTGSTATGRKIMANGSATLKRLTLELGGNDAAIVLDDVAVEAVADKIYQAAFYNAGQACLAIKRVYAHRAIYSTLCDAIAARASAAISGHGLEQSTQIGPIQNAAQFAKAKHYISAGEREGQIIAGGTVVEGKGFFVRPTVVRNIEDGSELVDQEQFSPVLPIIRIADAEDGLARANRSEYGLGGSVWSSDAARARSIAARLQSGTVWVNQHLSFGPNIPFAGAKQSGIGVEWTEHGLAEFTQLSVVNESY
ncbi:aldehyde dehydrogenase family protein [Paraburkholderia bengalensis]|uniref:Aldehyde dehydrogenase family protein n=1 Tax=Paraburkholderia bengalensis TaxID=2747562 RepID=A0ABU8J2V7_9BURK